MKVMLFRVCAYIAMLGDAYKGVVLWVYILCNRLRLLYNI